MLKRNRTILLGAVAVIALWFILYTVLVTPTWTATEEERKEAQDQLGRWVALYKSTEKGMALPVASKKLDEEKALLSSALVELDRIEFAKEMREYSVAAAGSGDPNNYFDRKRKEVVSYAKGRLNIQLAPGLEQYLGFQGKHSTDPVPLNLARLYMVKRFLQAAKRAGIKQILRIQYPRPGPVLEPETDAMMPPDEAEEEATAERIFQIPMVVRTRSPERNFAQFLYELQRPSGKKRPSDPDVSHFCLRGFLVSVKEDVKGVVDSQVAVAGIFPEKQYLKVLKIPFEVKSRGSSHVPRPILDPSRY